LNLMFCNLSLVLFIVSSFIMLFDVLPLQRVGPVAFFVCFFWLFLFHVGWALMTVAFCVHRRSLSLSDGVWSFLLARSFDFFIFPVIMFILRVILFFVYHDLNILSYAVFILLICGHFLDLLFLSAFLLVLPAYELFKQFNQSLFSLA
jgi:hypothetical protein